MGALGLGLHPPPPPPTPKILSMYSTFAIFYIISIFSTYIIFLGLIYNFHCIMTYVSKNLHPHFYYKLKGYSLSCVNEGHRQGISVILLHTLHISKRCMASGRWWNISVSDYIPVMLMYVYLLGEKELFSPTSLVCQMLNLDQWK